MRDPTVRYHVIDRWRTPASDYPRASLGTWSISTRRQEPGIYRMQEYGAFYYQPAPIDLTVLMEGDRVWFTDEPRQMYALAEIGLFRAHGNVIVGGLGLGLILSFLRQNPRVISLTTIERAEELRELVWPYVQVGELIIGDFYDVLPCLAREEEGRRVDTIITDFIFGYQTEATWEELQKQREFCKKHYPSAQFLEHGYQRRLDEEVVNKAIQPMPGVMFDQVKVVR